MIDWISVKDTPSPKNRTFLAVNMKLNTVTIMTCYWRSGQPGCIYNVDTGHSVTITHWAAINLPDHL